MIEIKIMATINGIIITNITNITNISNITNIRQCKFSQISKKIEIELFGTLLCHVRRLNIYYYILLS